MPSDIADRLETGFTDAGCESALHAIALSSGREVALRADAPVVMASVFKPLVALEFYAQAEAGLMDPGRRIELSPGAVTPGPVGVSNFQDVAQISLRDLAYLMLTLSDNAATDTLTRAVGLDHVNARAKVCGCEATVLESELGAMLDQVGREMGFGSYAQLLDAQSGRLGEATQARAMDPARLDAVSALDPAKGSRTTARDMTTFLAAVWRDAAAPPWACRTLRRTMAHQVTRRLEPAVPDGGALAAKSGGLFGRIRNEIGVISYPDGESYAVAVFTRAYAPFAGAAAINAQIGRAAALAISALRGG